MREGCEYYQFTKEPDQDLDILSPPIEGLEVDNFRVKIVKSKLHGHITTEARFIEEDIRTVSLREFLPDNEKKCYLEVQVPSPTNLLLLKLFAFNDRDEGQRQDSEQAQAHTSGRSIVIPTGVPTHVGTKRRNLATTIEILSSPARCLDVVYPERSRTGST